MTEGYNKGFHDIHKQTANIIDYSNMLCNWIQGLHAVEKLITILVYCNLIGNSGLFHLEAALNLFFWGGEQRVGAHYKPNWVFGICYIYKTKRQRS